MIVHPFEICGMLSYRQSNPTGTGFEDVARSLPMMCQRQGVRPWNQVRYLSSKASNRE